MSLEANNTMIYMRNITIRTAKSAPYLGNVGFSAALTAGCATEPTSQSDACDWVQPIRLSRADVLTEGTLAQIVAHNETGEVLCGWVP